MSFRRRAGTEGGCTYIQSRRGRKAGPVTARPVRLALQRSQRLICKDGSATVGKMMAPTSEGVVEGRRRVWAGVERKVERRALVAKGKEGGARTAEWSVGWLSSGTYPGRGRGGSRELHRSRIRLCITASPLFLSPASPHPCVLRIFASSRLLLSRIFASPLRQDDLRTSDRSRQPVLIRCEEFVTRGPISTGRCNHSKELWAQRRQASRGRSRKCDSISKHWGT